MRSTTVALVILLGMMIPAVFSAQATSAQAMPPVAFGPVTLVNESLNVGMAASDAAPVGHPHVAAFADGGYVVVWTVGGNGRTVLRARIFAGPGGAGPATGEYRLVTASGLQAADSVAALPDGSFVVAYHQVDASGRSIVLAGRFARNGVPLVRPFVVHAPSSSNRFGAVVTADPSAAAAGGFAVAWSGDVTQSIPPEEPVTYVNAYARRFTAAGQPLAPELTVARGSVEDAGSSAFAAGIAAAPDGTLWVAVNSVAETASVELVHVGRRGALLGLIQPDQGCCTAQYAATVKRAADGSLALVWAADVNDQPAGATIWAQSFAADGTPLVAAPLLVSGRLANESQPAVAAYPQGAFVAAWFDGPAAAGPGLGPTARVFGPGGGALSRPFAIDPGTHYDDQLLGDLAVSATGGLVAVWEDVPSGPSAIRARSITPPAPLAAGGD